MSRVRVIHCRTPSCQCPLARYRKQDGRLIKARNVRRVYAMDRQSSELICPACGAAYIWRPESEEAERIAA